MLKYLTGFFRKWVTRTDGEITIVLDKESVERFERLGSKIPTLNDRELIASSLICLEQKSDRIIKRQVTKKILALRKENYDYYQIANYLNAKRTPVLSDSSKWEHADVIALIDKIENKSKL